MAGQSHASQQLAKPNPMKLDFEVQPRNTLSAITNTHQLTIAGHLRYSAQTEIEIGFQFRAILRNLEVNSPEEARRVSVNLQRLEKDL